MLNNLNLGKLIFILSRPYVFIVALAASGSLATSAIRTANQFSYSSSGNTESLLMHWLPVLALEAGLVGFVFFLEKVIKNKYWSMALDGVLYLAVGFVLLSVISTNFLYEVRQTGTDIDERILLVMNLLVLGAGMPLIAMGSAHALAKGTNHASKAWDKLQSHLAPSAPTGRAVPPKGSGVAAPGTEYPSDISNTTHTLDFSDESWVSSDAQGDEADSGLSYSAVSETPHEREGRLIGRDAERRRAAIDLRLQQDGKPLSDEVISELMVWFSIKRKGTILKDIDWLIANNTYSINDHAALKARNNMERLQEDPEFVALATAIAEGKQEEVDLTTFADRHQISIGDVGNAFVALEAKIREDKGSF